MARNKGKSAKWVKISDSEYRKEVLGLTLIVEMRKWSARYQQKKTLISPAWFFRVLDLDGNLIIDGGEPVSEATRAKTLAGTQAKNYALRFARLDDYHNAIGWQSPISDVRPENPPQETISVGELAAALRESPYLSKAALLRRVEVFLDRERQLRQP